MSSWASILKAGPEPPPAASAASAEGPAAALKTAVLDANALISGTVAGLSGLAERFCTSQEVMDEIRDKQSRQLLASLPFVLEVKECSEESLKAVTRFARETGDSHALSVADMRLLALCHTMEVAAHGSSHIREHPVQASMRSRHRRRGHGMPGWGRVANPEEWKVVDEAVQDSSAAGGSRIQAVAQALDSGGQPGSAPQAPGGAQAAAAGAAGGNAPPLAFRTFAEAAAAAAAAAAGGPAASEQGGLDAAAAQALGSLHLGDGGAGGAGAVGVHLQGQGVAVDAGCSSSEGEGEGDEGWATAGRSRNAARRKNRRHAQYLARQAAREQQGQAQPPQAGQHGGGQAPPPLPEQPQQQQQQAGAAPCANHAGHCAGEGAPGDEGGAGDGAELSGSGSESGSDGEYVEEGSSEGGSDGEGGGEEGSEAGTAGAEAGGEGSSGAGPAVNTSSSVLCMTGDFAMQNVLLQMGLRLVAPDGRQITRVSRWALRCVACFFVTKEAGRLFCPRCGNATLERVEVMVSPEGAEFYGVRKSHTLRGTRFPLPKPKGGHGGNIILCEDQMLKKLRRRKKQADEAADPFAPEFGKDTWHVGGKTQAGLDPSKGAAYLLADWKHNPNERKHQASNRRRK